MPFCLNIYLLSFLQLNEIYLLLNRNTYSFGFIKRKIEVIFDQNRVILNVIELQGDEEFTSTNRSTISFLTLNPSPYITLEYLLIDALNFSISRFFPNSSSIPI